MFRHRCRRRGRGVAMMMAGDDSIDYDGGDGGVD